MSNVMASTNPTAPSSGERSRTAIDLRDEIHKRLSQAKGICRVIYGNPDAKAIDRSICDSLWAVDELIEEAQRAFKELKDVQS